MGTSWPVTFAATTGTGGGPEACVGAGALERCQTAAPTPPRAPAATSKQTRIMSLLRIERPSACFAQQPFIDVVPVEPNAPVVVVPVIADVPGQGVAETLGAGTPMVPL